MKYVLILLAAAALGYAIFYVVKSNPEIPSTPPPKEPAVKVRGAVLAGTGIVEPGTQNIAVGSALPGVVTSVIETREIGKVLKEGTLLFRLDDRSLKSDLKVREAALASAKAQLVRLESMPRKEEVVPVEVSLEMVKARKIEAKFVFETADKLIKENPQAVTKADWGNYKAKYQDYMAQEAKSEAELALLKAGAWGPDKDVAKAAVASAEAQVEQVKIELTRLEIKAPITSTLLQINLRVGEFVGAQPGQSLVLLGNLEQLHVRVDIDEHDASRFRPGMAALGYFRGQPDVSFPLEFVRVEPYVLPRKSLTGDNTERVDTRVLQVIYQIRNGTNLRHQINVGRQMDVFIGNLEAAADKKGPS